MNKEIIVNDLREMLETQSAIEEGDALADLEGWDSLATLNFIALADSKYNVQISPADLQKCKSVSDLITLVSMR